MTGPLLGWRAAALLLAASSLLTTADSRQLAPAGIGAHVSVLQNAQLSAAAQWRQQVWRSQTARRALLGTAAAEATSAPTAAPTTAAASAPSGKDTDYIVAIVVGKSVLVECFGLVALLHRSDRYTGVIFTQA